MNDLISIEVSVPNIACEYIMQTAIEGGIGYWSTARNIVRAGPTLIAPRQEGNGVDTEDIRYWSYEVTDREDFEEQSNMFDDEIAEANSTWHRVDYDVIRKGLALLFKKGANVPRVNFLCDYVEWLEQYCDADGQQRYPVPEQIFGGTMDSIDCDTIVQLGVFGEVVYG